MKAMFGRLRSTFMLLVVCMSLVVGGQAWATAIAIDYERAKLVSKFAKYVGWPADAIQSEFIIGVYQDTEKHKFLSDYFANKGVNGKDIEVRLVETINEGKSVNILYISSTKKRALLLAHQMLKGLNVLIVTENSSKHDKTMIDISYSKQKTEIFLRINKENIANTQLEVPALSYFLDKKNNVDILTVSPTTALKNKKVEQLLALKEQLSLQKTSLFQLNNKLKLSKEKSTLDFKKEAKRLQILKQKNTKQIQEIISKNEQLQNLKKQLQAQKIQIETQEVKLNTVQTQFKVQKNTVQQNVQTADDEKTKAQDKIVIDLTEQLKKQYEITKNTTLKLTNMTQVNMSLSNFKILFYIFVISTMIALYVAFMMWKKSKRSPSFSSLELKSESDSLLLIRENQLTKSENLAALGYIATDVTYAVGLSLDDLQVQLQSTGDDKNIAALKPVVTLLENFNLMAADQDDTEIQSFDVIAYLQKMMMLYDFEFSQSEIVYNYCGERELTIKAIPSYIALVLLNLINNSLKHGFDNNGSGKIALNVERGVNSGVKITYSDDGKGMSKAVLNQIFTPFFTTQSARGYVGIGMSTTYDLITNKLAGNIKVESQEGEGTTVIITLL